MSKEKKFKIHSMTVEDENGVIVTLDLNNWTITPANIDPSVAANLWLRLGAFIGGGDMALKTLWGEK